MTNLTRKEVCNIARDNAQEYRETFRGTEGMHAVYRSILGKLGKSMRTIGAAGLVALAVGCDNQVLTPNIATNEVMALGIYPNETGGSTVLKDNNGEIRAQYFYCDQPILMDLPAGSKPILIEQTRGSKIHLPADSRFIVSKQNGFQFELQLNEKPATK